jgi:DNA-binding NtrC family response regulator
MVTRRSDITELPKKSLKVLFADDEPSLQKLMSQELRRMGHEVTVCPDGLVAVAALERNTYDCLVVDLDMPGMGGIDVIHRAKEMSPETEAIVMTGKSSLETAVAALRHGVFDYITKPCKLADLDRLLQRVASQRELMNKYRAIKRRLERIEGESKLVGSSNTMKEVSKLISKVAPTHSTVLILGETGTGKELVARSVHEQSLRGDQPFVAVNCGALPETLIESELFGHRKGAFTGAEEHRVGLFEVADGGTLMLDEIGELPMSMQSKLLRVLESGEVRRVGENEAFKVDVRIICATHRPLEEMVHEDQFREDLMFRINTFEIQLPPLRNRIDDIPELVDHLLLKMRDSNTATLRIDEAALEALKSHVWPGNVRELANVIEHATILCDDVITPEHLPRRFDARRLRRESAHDTVPKTLREIEMESIHQAIERNDGNKPKTAEELGISLKTLYNKLNSCGPHAKAA